LRSWAPLGTEHVNKEQCLTRLTSELASSLPVGSLGISALGLQHCDVPSTAINVQIICPSATTLAVSHVLPRVYTDRPLDLTLATVGLLPGIGSLSVARWLSAHARITIVVEVPGCPGVVISSAVTVYLFGDGLIVRALIRPATWADACSVRVELLTLAWLPVLCECFPAILRVGYNHVPAPAGEVHSAALDGNVPALQAALDAGGSTEEADEVRGWGVGVETHDTLMLLQLSPH